MSTNLIRQTVWLTLSLVIITALSSCGKSDHQTIYTAKQIVTMDKSTPSAEAVLVKNGRILQIGDVESLSSEFPDAIVDSAFSDKILVPGLIDPHVHMIMGAMIYSRPFVPPWDMETPAGRVQGLPNKQALLARLKELESALDVNDPLIAYGYHNLVHGDLTRQDLDTVSTTRPVIIWHYSGHDFYLNSAALDWADVDKSLAKKYVGVALDDNGELTGRLYEDAPKYLFGKLARQILTPGNIRTGFSGFEEMLARAGVTTVAELGYGLFGRKLEDFYYLLEYTADDPYRLYMVPEHRAFVEAYGDGALTKIQALSSESESRGKPQVLPQVKFFTDAAFYSQTMRLDEPGYVTGQSAGTHGLWVTPPGELESALKPYWEADIQVRIHSNGDAAQTATLSAFAALRALPSNQINVS